MPISSVCPQCHQPLTVADAAAGKKVQCWSCRSIFVLEIPPPRVPEVTEPASPPSLNLKLSCFVCFEAISVDVRPGDTSATCPSCESTLQIADLVAAGLPEIDGLDGVIEAMNADRLRQIREGDKTLNMFLRIAVKGVRNAGD